MGTITSVQAADVRTEDCLQPRQAPPDQPVANTESPVCTGPTPEHRLSGLDQLVREVPAPILAQQLGYNPRYLTDRVLTTAPTGSSTPL